MPDFIEKDEKYMQRCLKLAHQAAESGEAPVGALVVQHENGVDRIIAEGMNMREISADPTSHAEIVAIRRAATVIGSWRLDNCTLYVTLEPCAMCAGAIILARIPRVVYGTRDPKAGACGSVMDITGNTALNHNPIVDGGLMADACGRVLTDFFKRRRAENRRGE